MVLNVLKECAVQSRQIMRMIVSRPPPNSCARPRTGVNIRAKFAPTSVMALKKNFVRRRKTNPPKKSASMEKKSTPASNAILRLNVCKEL